MELVILIARKHAVSYVEIWFMLSEEKEIEHDLKKHDIFW